MKLNRIMTYAASLTAGFALMVACKDDPETVVPQLAVEPATVAAAAEGGASTITVSANTAWTAVSDSPAWVTVSEKTDNSFVVTVEANQTASARTAAVTVSVTADPTVNKVVAVTQNTGGEISLTVTPATVDVAAEGGAKEFAIATNGVWEASSDKDWANVSPASGSTDGKITVTAEPNTGDARTATISVTAGDKTVSVTVKQAKSAAVPDPTMQAFVVPDNAVVGDTWDLKDERDDQMYPAVKMHDGKVWMAKNLNFTKDLASDGYRCQDEHCDRWGVHYGWALAEVACPSGWHIATRDEAVAFQDAVVAAYGSVLDAILALCLPNDAAAGFDYWNAETHPGVVNYNNASKFNAIGNGNINADGVTPDHFPRLARYWVNQGKLEFGWAGTYIAVEGFSETEYFCVRCIKD
ncbi:MAG: hypothetical protein LBT48_06525 [Prevotellaceae bacterium]|jgi:uncharacterized protein (TIGR02145 family)|nr:hypothetical protein [Prevotellaceae bacterium]